MTSAWRVLTLLQSHPPAPMLWADTLVTQKAGDSGPATGISTSRNRPTMASAYALYLASFLGGVALYMMMPRANRSIGRLGALLGAATLGGLWLGLHRFLPADLGLPRGAFAYSYVFGALGIGSAVRVITHTKPVYAALWFVMVMLATAGLLLTLSAPFVAFALVIIYGGAILVTYVFVIMLAAAAGDPGDQTTPIYDRTAHEPFAATCVGFLLLAVLLGVAFEPLAPQPAAPSATDAAIIADIMPNRAATRLAKAPRASIVTADAAAGAATVKPLTNIERVGLDLFRGEPLGLELAGVILLVALIGAVVLARQRVEEEKG